MDSQHTTNELTETEITPLSRLLACKKPTDPRRCFQHLLPPGESHVALLPIPPYYTNFESKHRAFYEEAFNSISIPKLKAFMEFSRIKSDIQERLLDEEALQDLQTYLATCQLSDFIREEYDCEIIEYFPTNSMDDILLTVCLVFCLHISGYRWFPANVDDIHFRYVLALDDLYFRSYAANIYVDDTHEYALLMDHFEEKLPLPDPSQDGLGTIDTPYQAELKPLEEAFCEATKNADSMEPMKTYLRFSQAKGELEQKALDKADLESFIETCHLSDFKQFDNDIAAFFQIRSTEPVMLKLCRAFCDIVHHDGFPTGEKKAKYIKALHRSRFELHRDVDITSELNHIGNCAITIAKRCRSGTLFKK